MTNLVVCEKIGRQLYEKFDYKPIEKDTLHTLHLPRSGREVLWGAKYVGPISAWHGKTAGVTPLIAAQFDDRGHYMAYGWHLFNAKDWKLVEKVPLYKAYAEVRKARINCTSMGNHEGRSKWGHRLDELEEFLPTGSGFDNGTQFDESSSTDAKLVFKTSYHHMNETGHYTGWTEHEVIVTPDLQFDFHLRVTGANRNGIKDYIYEVFSNILNMKVNRY